MKKAILIAFLFMAAINVKAQNGLKFFSLRGGWVAKNAFSGTLSYDFNTRYFNQNEVFAEYYQNYKHHDYKSIMGGFVLKPVMFRNGNTAVRYRFGAGIGTTTRKFVAAPQLGFEFAQSVGSGIDLLIMNRNQFTFWGDGKDRWRVGIEAGIRIPLN